ncbi:hypothetical protein HRbin12_01664 [bacterium HR12]|nr:hypothetical protein HRbin12_01664 [bacterium HR12]GIV00387.1 MAG: hypothetical protein KatS3mg014_2002 [Actinomycetota bacterium]
MLAVLGMIWATFLLAGDRVGTPRRTIEGFERDMELLAETGRSGRWIVTPRKGTPFIGPEARARQRTLERRRRVFVALLESIALTFLIGLAPPLRSVWYVTGLLLALLGAYVWLLLWLKHEGPRARALERARLVRVPESPTVPRTRYVTDASSRTPRPAVNGLVVDPADPVRIVVRPASAARA